jgi:hypothetical protein
VTKTLGGGDAKNKSKKKQQQQQQSSTSLQSMHNNNKSGGGGNSSSSGSDSSDSSSSSSEESDSESEPETKPAAAPQNSVPPASVSSNNMPRQNPSTPKLPANNSLPPTNDSALGNNIKVRNDLMPGGGGGRMSGDTTPNSMTGMPPFNPSNFSAGVISQPPMQAVRPFPPSVVTTPQQSPTELLQQQQQQMAAAAAKLNAPGLAHLSVPMNSADIPSIDSPAAPQKTKAMLKGWSSLAGPGSTGTMGGGIPVPSMTAPVSSMPIPVTPHHPVPAVAAGPPPEHSSRSGSGGNGGGGGGSSNVNKSQILQQKASDTFNAFRKAAQEKTERERQLKEQQETVRLKKEAAERERKRQEHERKRELQDEEMLEQARRSMQIVRTGSGAPAAPGPVLPGLVAAMDNGNGNSSGISPSGMSPVMTDAARVRQREREKEQERRRREAKAGGIDMNMQSDLMAAFEENII